MNINSDSNNSFGIDFSILDQIPDGLDEFLVDMNFLEQFEADYFASGGERRVFDEAMKSLKIYDDKANLIRYMRIVNNKFRAYLKREPKDAVDTQAEFNRLKAEYRDQVPRSQTVLLMQAKRVLERAQEAVEVEVPRMFDELKEQHRQEMQELKEQLALMRQEQHEGFAKAIDKLGAGAPTAQPQTKKKDEEARELTPEEIAQAAKEQAEAMELQKKERQKKLKESALEFVARKMQGDTEAAQALLDGLAEQVDSEGIFRSVDESSVATGKLDWDKAYSSKMSEIYLLYSKCGMTVNGLRNALAKLFNKKYKKD